MLNKRYIKINSIILHNRWARQVGYWTLSFILKKIETFFYFIAQLFDTPYAKCKLDMRAKFLQC